MSDWKNRLVIKHLFVLNFRKDVGDQSKMLDIAIVTSDEKYVEYEMSVRHSHLTHYNVARFKQVFSDYQFTPNSDVCFSSNIPEGHPAYMFVSIIA